MIKYIDIDKLKAEIERLKDEYTDIAIDSHYGTVNANSVVDDLEQLLSLITSLQQEQLNTNVKEKAISLQIQAYLTTASDELYAPGKPLYTESHHKGIHECMLMWQKLHQYYFSTMQEQPEYGYLSTEYIHGKKSRWSVGDVLAYYICTSNEEGEYLLGKIVNVEFDKEDGWVYTFEDGSTWDEQSLVEEETYKKNYNGK